MSSPAPRAATPETVATSEDRHALSRFGRLSIALFLSYLAVAMLLPTTSIQVIHHMGLGNSLAGLAVGIAFGSTIVTRGSAGRLADQHGGRKAMIWGLVVYVFAALTTLASTLSTFSTWQSYTVMILGRLLFGIGESLTIIGILSWGIGMLGPHRAGKVIGRVGMAMYGAFAAGGPLGLFLYQHTGYAGLSVVCLILPFIGLSLTVPVPPSKTHAGERPSFIKLIGRIWDLGAVVLLQGIGFATIGAFMSLMFLHAHWPHAGLGLTCFGGAFVLIRVICGHLPDRIGGAVVAFCSMVFVAAGQSLLWLAPGPWVALIGATLTGGGCAMMFPAMGVEVVRRVPAHLRGTAMGGCAAFQDLAYGATGPLTGLLADRAGYPSVFLVGAVAALLGLVMSGRLFILDRKQDGHAPL